MGCLGLENVMATSKKLELAISNLQRAYDSACADLTAEKAQQLREKMRDFFDSEDTWCDGEEEE